jgi:hypothetical protein
MGIELVLGIYATVFFLALVPLIWLVLRHKRKKASAAEPTAGAGHVRPSRQIDWSTALAFRPKNPLSGEMWLKSLIAAFLALCSAVIVIVFIFPLGAGWAAAAAFVAATAVVGVIFTLVE